MTSDHHRSSGPDTEETTAHLSDVESVREGDRTHGMVLVLAGPQNGTLFILDQPEITIGRGRANQIYLNDEGLSRRHARISRRADGFYLEDLHSKNGTFCQRQRVREPRRLIDGDRITMGANTVLRFTLQDSLEREASRQTVELTIRDPLTQLLNRRHLEDRLRGEFAYASRHGTRLHVLMVDLDHFKEVNDEHGHQAGDKVLRAVAAALERTLRVEDVIGRYGGEEFLVVARGIDTVGIEALADRLRKVIEDLDVHWESKTLKITASIGVATVSTELDTPEKLVAAADEAMYRAKGEGRNRTALA